MEHFSDRHHLADAKAIADVAAYISQLDRDISIGEGNGELLDQGADSYNPRWGLSPRRGSGAIEFRFSTFRHEHGSRARTR